jgi:lipoprotein-anchoring transpeptidase ErfK/SrfK
LPPTPEEALDGGVLIVVSLASQRMYVFRDGDLWDSSKVSTGRRGNETPVGTFPILQKKVHHRSNLYDDAPMPYMQRLTWGGVALHAGHVPGYAASHGCIRMPKAFAKKLYGITGFSSTAVVVTDERLASAEDALEVA